MTWVNKILNNFVGGEVSSEMYGRYDLPFYDKACEALINFLIKTQGPATFRQGFKYVNRTRNNSVAVSKRFIFNNDVSYFLEFTDQKLRFFRNQEPIKETAKNITDVSTSAQAVVTAVGHGYSDGDEVFIYDTVGTESLNGRNFIVSDKDTDTFKIKDLWGAYVSTVGSAYSSGGTAQRVYELTTPYTAAAGLSLIQTAQNVDTMVIVHPSFRPYALTRTSDANWTIDFISNTGDPTGTKTGTAFPFTSAGNYPRAVAFAQGKLWFGGTDNAIDKFWGSRGPQNDGTTRYFDFTTGTEDTHAVVFILNPPSGKVEAIEWISANDKYLIIGTYGGVSKVTGARDDEAITATSISVRQLANQGVYPTPPVPLGGRIFYVQRSGLIVRELKYDLAADGLVPYDRNLVSTEITGEGVETIDFAEGRPEIVWGHRSDGLLIGATVTEEAGQPGWHRHPLGGSGTVQSLTTIPRAGLDDQLWAITQRTINGTTVNYVEYMVDEPTYPKMIDFFTGTSNKTADTTAFKNVMFNKQRQYKHLDCHLTWNGSDRSTTASAALALSLSTSTAVLTTDNSIFESEDVGRQVWGGYNNTTGLGGGRFEITEVVSATTAKATILSSPSDGITSFVVGDWYITTDTITGLEHLEGETIQVVADGGNQPDVTVSDGSVTLESQHSVVHLGYKYKGIMKTLNLEAGGVNGPAQTKRKRIIELAVRFINTLGAAVGTSLYNLETVRYATTDQLTGRPPLPVNGFKHVPVNDEYIGDRADDIATHIVVLQDYPLPCTVAFIDSKMEVVNE